jgi:hypothetical protein
MAFKKRQIETEGDDEPQVTKKSKAKANQTAKGSLTQGKDAEGNPYWEVGFVSSHQTLQFQKH